MVLVQAPHHLMEIVLSLPGTVDQDIADAVQVLGGAGLSADHPVERWMRDAKVLQIVEGTNQVQRIVMARKLLEQY